MKKIPTPPKGPRPNRHTPALPPELEEISALLARIEQPANWLGLDSEDLLHLSWLTLTSIKDCEDDRLAEIAGPIYIAFRDSAPDKERAMFIDEIVKAVASGLAAVEALMLLCLVENSPQLIAIGAAAYADARGMAEANPIPATELLLSDWEEDDPEHRAGIFLGLLMLGEPVILDELKSRRVQLTDDEVGMICDATIVNPCYTTVEFTLEWLEEVQAHHDHGKFAMLASAITPVNIDIKEADEAPQPAGAGLDISGDVNRIPDDCYTAIAPLLLGKHLTSRLRAIASRETGTRVMTAVLEAYGLEPVVEVN